MKANRRDFLKVGMAWIAAASLPSCSGTEKEEKTTGESRSKSHTIVERTLGRTGIKIPIMSMGGVARDKATYRAALDAGIRHIDTDSTFRNGWHEKMVGEIIRERPRESLIVATKVKIPSYNGRGPYPPGTRGEELLRPFEASMKRLGVEYLDILYLHSISSAAAVDYDPVVETLQKLKGSGRTRFLGISVHGYEPDVIRAVVDCGAYDVIMVSYNFKQRHVSEIKKAIAFAADAGLGIVAMKTQAGAFLDRERTRPVNHRAAIKWVLSDNNVHTAIPGFRNIEEMEMYLSVMGDLELTPEEEADLVSAGLEPGLYCLQCGRCVPQCPYEVPVPAYMRAFMYAYGYGNPAKAKETISGISQGEPPCGSCASCNVSCQMGFDVRGRIRDIARLRAVSEDFLPA
jgi:predicted aldo/keto reductase-like oxidoreductase